MCKTLFLLRQGVEEASKDGFQRSNLQHGKRSMPSGEADELEQNGA